MEGENWGEPTGADITSIDADALMSQIESRQPVGQEAPQEVTPPAQPAQATQPQAPLEIEFTAAGKQIKAPISDPRIKQWASQGYDYAQKMAEFNKTQQEFQAQQQQAKAYFDKYGPVEEFYSKNPDLWNHIVNQWQQSQAQQGLGDPNNPVMQKLSAYDEKLSQVEKFIQSKQAEEAAFIRQQEDQALDSEIKSIRETYADLDFSSPGADGKSLELKVLEHAHQNGIKSFKSAFRDYMHEELIKREYEKGKESVVKERQKQTKLGLLGKSPAPKNGLTQATDIKSKSYDQLLREGIEELGLSLGG